MKIWLILISAFLFLPGCKNADSKNAEVDDKLFLPDSLEVTLWAESPMIHNPTNVDVDSRGRLWVTEAVNYRNFNNDSTKFFHYNKGDRIVILEDTNNDGKADTAITYVQDTALRSPVGIAVMGNQVVVSCSPNLIVYTDTNGDDHPDKKEVLLTGFGGFDHDHSLHAVFGGPDGNWYFNTGNAGPHHVTDKSGWSLRSGSLYTGGTPYNNVNQGNQKSDDGRVWVGGLALRIRPDGTGLKVMGHNFRNSYEVFPDSYGNMWQNDNDDQVVTCRTSWLMEGGNAGYFSTDGTRYWQADQRPGQDIFNAHWHQDDPGVMPAGDRTGAGAPTGVLRIETNELGAGYYGMLLSADAGRNVVFGYSPRTDKSGYDLGKRLNLVTSLTGDNEGYVWNDSAGNSKKESWFRPSDIAIGTEGALYIADWYDPVVGGHQMEDTAAIGRIYRISPKSKKLLKPRYDLRSAEGQIAAFKSPAINVRFIAAGLLEKQGPAVIGPLKKLLNDGDPFLHARTIWLLSRCGAEGISVVRDVLKNPSAQLRMVAFRALRNNPNEFNNAITGLAGDTSVFVQRELAIALRDEPFEVKKQLLPSILSRYNANDRWFLEALGAAMDDHAAYWYQYLKSAMGSDPTRWSAAMADLAWRLHPAESVADFTIRARDTAITETDRTRALTALGFTKSRAAAVSMMQLSNQLKSPLNEQASYWLGFRKDNDWASFLDWSQFGSSIYAQKKLAASKVDWQTVMDKRQSDYERKARLNNLLTDSVGGQFLLDQVAANRVPEEWKPVIEKKIFDNPDPGVRMQAMKFFKPKAGQPVIDVNKVLKLVGNPANGKKLFALNCASCHKAENSKAQIGPELAGITKKLAPPELLQAIIEPDAAIVFGYEPIQVKDRSGTTTFGFLISENDQSIVLRELSGERVSINKKNISERVKQEHSLMPSAAMMKLSGQDLADIISFLKSVNVE